MECKVSLDINKRKMDKPVKKYGAKIITGLSVSTVSEQDFTETAKLPTKKAIAETNAFERGASYVFSNVLPTTTEGLTDLVSLEDKKTTKKLIASGANLFKGISDDFFARNPDKVLNPIRNEKEQLIVMSSNTSNLENSTRKGYIKISAEDVAFARGISAEEFLDSGLKEDGQTFSKEENDTFNEGIEFLIISALYRGYNIIIDGNVSPDVISSAVKRYNRNLKPRRIKTRVISPIHFGKGFERSNKPHIAAEMSEVANQNTGTTTYDSNLMLSMTLSEKDRKTYKTYKKASNASKAYVARQLAKVFNSTIEGLNMEVLTPSEIEEIYGRTFLGKKGFIIGGKVILNSDNLTSDTVFHEFGHYYMEWLKRHDVKAYYHVLNNVRNEYGDQLESYTKIYDQTGISFSEEDVLIELFVDKLGMLATKDIEQAIMDSENTVDKTIEDFTTAFLQKLTRNKNVNSTDADFGLMSTITDMFNIGLVHSGEYEQSPLYDEENETQLRFLREFFMEEPTATQLFNSLIARGLVIKLPNNKIILTDIYGNRYNTKGELDADASYTYHEMWDTPSKVRANEKFLAEADGFLDKFKNEAQVFFSTGNVSIITNEEKIRRNSMNVKLASDDLAYEIKDANGSIERARRTTGFSGDTFGNGAEGKDYAVSLLWSKYINEYTATEVLNKGMSAEEIDKAAIKHAEKRFQDPDFQNKLNDVMRIFEFKTDEGTYLHDLAEFYFRTLQYSNEIDFGSKMKGGYTHFAGPIRDAIVAGGTKFTGYIDKLFIANLQDKAGTKDYELYQESYQKMKKALSSHTKANASEFINLLDKKVIPVLDKLSGPLTIMPEVQLASKKLKVAGKIDLLVLDGSGRAYIFDYKTKTEKKMYWWDYNSPVKMKGVMKDYADNAMMRASIQTSIYKLILRELGIETGPSNIFYVENKIIHKKKVIQEGYTEDDVYYDKENLEYQPIDIKRKPVLDVTAELYEHFTENEKRDLDFITTTDRSSNLKDIILKAAGGQEIDSPSDVDATVNRVYDRAVNRGVSKSAEAKERIMARISSDYKAKEQGLTVTISGNTTFRLPPGISEQEAKALIKEAILEKKAIKNIEAEFINRFNKLDRYNAVANVSERVTDRDHAYRSLLVDTDSTTHEITKLSSNIDYGVDSSGILLVKNKVTKGTRIILLNHDSPRKINFGNDRKNLFGNYISDNKANMLYPRGFLKANTFNMRLVKLGIILAQQKLENPDFTVEVVMSNNRFKNKTIPNIHDVGTMVKLAQDMLTVMRDSGEAMPQEMTELLNHPHLFESKSYMENPVDALLEYLSISTGTLVTNNDFFRPGTKAATHRDYLKEVLEKERGFENTQDLIDALLDFRNSLMLSKNKSLDAKITDDVWTLTGQVIMYLQGFNYLISPKNTTMIDNYLMTTSKTANMYQTYYNRKLSESQVNLREDFIEFKKEHNQLIQNIAKSKGIDLGNMGSNLYTTSRKRIFNNLFAYDNDNKDRTKVFRLRDHTKPSKTTKSNQTTLNSDEIAYLKFFKEKSQEFAELSSRGSTKPVVPSGWMPLMRKTNLSMRQDLDLVERAQAGYENVKKSLSPDGSTQKKPTPVEEEFSLENRFQGQIPSKSSDSDENWTSSRRESLGVDETGEIIDHEVDISLIEDNLENVLDNFAIASLEAYNFRNVSEFGRALFYNIKRFERLSGGTSYNAIVDTLALIQKRIVKHQKDSDTSPIFSAANSLATSVVTLGTVNQALLETFTNPLVTTSTYMADKLYGVMFNGHRDFSAKNFAKAAKMVWMGSETERGLLQAIDNLYGMTNMDTRNLQKVLNQLEANSLFQSEHLMFVNKIMLENWQKITMVAYMLEQGTFYAHEVTKDGDLVYNEKDDKRFFGNGGSLESRADKKARYDATKEELAKQRNGLTGTVDDAFEDRKLKRAWTNYDVNYLKEIIVEAYSSMDEFSKSLASFYVLSGAFFKMRTWLFPKIPRYFKKTMSAEEGVSLSKLVKVDAPGTSLGYRYEWKGSETEGILYTFQYLMRNAYEQKYWIFSKGAWKFKNEEQKKNMSRLFADVGVATFIAAGVNGVWAYALDDEQRKNTANQLIKDRLMLAIGDVVLPYSLLDVATNNGALFISGAIAARAVKSAFSAAWITPQALFNDDIGIEEVSAAYSNLLGSTIGTYKSLVTVNEIVEEATE